MEECLICGDKAIHFPVFDWAGTEEPYCGYCFHGVSMEQAVELEGCENCSEELELVQKGNKMDKYFNYVLVTEYDGELYSTHRINDFADAADIWSRIKDHGNAKNVANYTMTDPTGNSFHKTFFAAELVK